MTRTEVIALYLPVLDSRVVNFLKHHGGRLRILWVLDSQLVEDYFSRGEVPKALDQKDVIHAIQSWKLFGTVTLIDRSCLRYLSSARVCIIMPDDDVCHAIADQYFNGYKIVFMPIDSE